MSEPPKLYTGSEKLKAELEKLYPSVEVVLTEPLPTNQPSEA